MLLEVSLMNVVLGISEEIKRKVEVVLLKRIIDELDSWDIQGDEMENEGDVTRSINMNFILRISKKIKYKLKVVLLEVSLMNFILGISNEIYRKVKLLSLELSLMN